MLCLAEFKPSAGRIILSRRRSQIFGLAEFKPKLLLNRPEIYSKPARGSSTVHISVSLTKVTLTCIHWARLWPLGVQALAAWSHLTHPNWSNRLGLGQ